MNEIIVPFTYSELPAPVADEVAERTVDEITQTIRKFDIAYKSLRKALLQARKSPSPNTETETIAQTGDDDPHGREFQIEGLIGDALTSAFRK